MENLNKKYGEVLKKLPELDEDVRLHIKDVISTVYCTLSMKDQDESIVVNMREDYNFLSRIMTIIIDTDAEELNIKLEWKRINNIEKDKEILREELL